MLTNCGFLCYNTAYEKKTIFAIEIGKNIARKKRCCARTFYATRLGRRMI